VEVVINVDLIFGDFNVGGELIRANNQRGESRFSPLATPSRKVIRVADIT